MNNNEDLDYIIKCVKNDAKMDSSLFVGNTCVRDFVYLNGKCSSCRRSKSMGSAILEIRYGESIGFFYFNNVLYEGNSNVGEQN